MIRIIIIALFGTFMIGFVAQAKPKKQQAMGAQLKTEHNFNALTVHGRYRTGYQGLVTVENEKGLSDLLDYRKELKDRIRQSAHYKVKP